MNTTVVIERMFKECVHNYASVGQKVFADDAVRVREPVRKAAGLGHQKQTRGFRAIRAYDYRAGLLENLFSARIEIDGTADLSLRIDFDFPNVGTGPDFAASRLLRNGDHC